MSTTTLSQSKKNQYLQVRLDANMKKRAELVLDELGLTMTQAVKLFFRQIIMRKAIPFAVVIPENKREFASADEEAAIEESLEQIGKGKKVIIDMSDSKKVSKYFGI